jgi:hypothetical protein
MRQSRVLLHGLSHGFFDCSLRAFGGFDGPPAKRGTADTKLLSDYDTWDTLAGEPAGFSAECG